MISACLIEMALSEVKALNEVNDRLGGIREEESICRSTKGSGGREQNNELDPFGRVAWLASSESRANG